MWLNGVVEVVYLEIIRARGHPNIKALHRTTLELTREPILTPRGDCIIGVSADKAPANFNEDFKNCIRRDNAILVALIEVPGIQEVVLAHGNSQLLLTSNTRTVLRKSTYIEPGTIAIRASKAAGDLRRDLVEKLRDASTQVEVELYCVGLDEITSIYKYLRSVL
jgi:hypothetical protein